MAHRGPLPVPLALAGAMFALLALLAPLAAAAAEPAPRGGFDPAVARRITPEQVRERIAGGARPVFIDTRGRATGSIVRGALHLPGGRLSGWAARQPRDLLIVAYCT